MKVKEYQYLYVERIDGEPESTGTTYAKPVRTYREAKEIFDQAVRSDPNEGGYIGPSNPPVLDKFTSLSGKIFEITFN